MLEANVIQQLETYLKLLKFPLHITATIGSDDASLQMQALLKEIQQCAPNITLDFNGNHAFKPSFGIARVVNGQTEAPRVHFAGIPLGHEFTSLLLALLHVGGHPPKIEAEHIQTIQSLSASENDGHFTTVISLSCHNCPDVVQAFNTIAALNPNFTHTMVDGALFQQWVEEKKYIGRAQRV